MVQAADRQSAGGKDVAALLEEAFDNSGITQYELAKRMAALRDTHLGSQDQAIRRIRRQGQTPTEDVARDLARAFKPELKLADDHFFSPRRPLSADLRRALAEAVEDFSSLRREFADLREEVDRLSKLVARRVRRGAPRQSP